MSPELNHPKQLDWCSGTVHFLLAKKRHLRHRWTVRSCIVRDCAILIRSTLSALPAFMSDNTLSKAWSHMDSCSRLYQCEGKGIGLILHNTLLLFRAAGEPCHQLPVSSYQHSIYDPVRIGSVDFWVAMGRVHFPWEENYPRIGLQSRYPSISKPRRNANGISASYTNPKTTLLQNP